jgi:hypothetical protein
LSWRFVKIINLQLYRIKVLVYLEWIEIGVVVGSTQLLVKERLCVGVREIPSDGVGNNCSDNEGLQLDSVSDSEKVHYDYPESASTIYAIFIFSFLE